MVESKPDYFKVLGVPRNASTGTVRSAYRTLAKKYHPDRNPGDNSAERRFKEVGEAYEVLNDPQKRKDHESLLKRGEREEKNRQKRQARAANSAAGDAFGEAIRNSARSSGSHQAQEPPGPPSPPKSPPPPPKPPPRTSTPHSGFGSSSGVPTSTSPILGRGDVAMICLMFLMHLVPVADVLIEGSLRNPPHLLIFSAGLGCGMLAWGVGRLVADSLPERVWIWPDGYLEIPLPYFFVGFVIWLITAVLRFG